MDVLLSSMEKNGVCTEDLSKPVSGIIKVHFYSALSLQTTAQDFGLLGEFLDIY